MDMIGRGAGAEIMKSFYNKNFLLQNTYGKRLYHEVAAALPIIDPHNHIDPSALSTNKKFENIYQLWVQHDPYKHRAMRLFGMPEELITGNRSDYEKFLAWAQCYPHTAGNPLFHWSAMELKEVFGIKEILTPENAKQVWEEANKKLAKKGYGALDIIKGLGVEMLCTSDDLLDSLEHHLSLWGQQSSVLCLPSLRSDSIIAFTGPAFCTWLDKLKATTDVDVHTLQSYKEAIIRRLKFFDEAGCLLSDHSLDSGFRFIPTDESTAATLFKSVLNREPIGDNDAIKLQSHLLHFLGIEYAKRKWKMQLHIGAHRYTSSVLRDRLGPAGGYAGIGGTINVESLCLFLDGLDKEGALPKTILYTLNPADNAVLATLTGSFSEDNVQGKIQFGPAWWYNDHYEGIVQQVLALSSYGLLSTSIGMTTDSRSLLSFVRHDYYRRILCDLLGSWVEKGKLPDDFGFVATLVKNISYFNIKKWIQK
jgi:glucuronate isomerase